MKTYLAVAAAVLALAGCSSSSSDPSAAAPSSAASSAAAAPSSAAATSSAAAGTTAGGPVDRSKDCPDAVLAAKAALAGLSVTDVYLPEGCTVVSIKTPLTDPAIGKDMCEKVAGEVFDQYGIVGITVEADDGTSLAIGAPSQPCRTL